MLQSCRPLKRARNVLGLSAYPRLKPRLKPGATVLMPGFAGEGLIPSAIVQTMT
jgi:hypothetical protein